MAATLTEGKVLAGATLSTRSAAAPMDQDTS